MTEQAIETPDLDDYDFELAPESIAQTALEVRDEARLLRLDRGRGAIVGAGGERVRDLPQLLQPGDLLVVNATRVVKARLRGHKTTGGGAEALLLGRERGPGDAALYRALVKVSGRLRTGLRFEFGPPQQQIRAELIELAQNGEAVLAFEPGVSPYEVGEAPLPPYIRRSGGPAEHELRERDLERYQTVFAREPGAIAAPTAGLHLTESLLADLERGGVQRAEVILHVGAGTFRPVRREDLEAGRLHSEAYELPAATAEAIARTRAAGGRVVAVGTTTARVLETRAAGGGLVSPGAGETDLFLRPGSDFAVVDGLLTNFHLPRSSLLLLVAAFVGREAILAAYQRAIEQGYRFYSYGDAMLII